MMERVGVVGCRDLPAEQVEYLRKLLGELSPTTIIVTGDCPTGADRVAREVAAERGMVLLEYQADWKTHGKAAGPMRNREMVTSMDRMIALWDGRSPGTRSAIQEARRAEVPVDLRMFVRL